MARITFRHRGEVTVVLLAVGLAIIRSGIALRITNLNAPSVQDLREDMDLTCEFDMEKDTLHSVKWYKDDQEFFRFTPREEPKQRSFPKAGIRLQEMNTDCRVGFCNVRLMELVKDHSGGAYKCEISSEGPKFKSSSETVDVTVAVLPKQPPRITGISGTYAEGETIKGICISDLADPAPILTWYINGQEALHKYVGEMISSPPDPSGLVSKSLSLTYPVDRKHSQNDIELKCIGAQPGIPLPAQSTTWTVPNKQQQPPQVQQPLQRASSSRGAAMSASYCLLFTGALRLMLR